MSVCPIPQVCSFMVKVFHEWFCTHLCVCVSSCACVFEFVYVLVYGEGCA